MGWRWCKPSVGLCRSKLGTKCRQDLRLEHCLHHKPTEPETVLGKHHHVLTLFVHLPEFVTFFVAFADTTPCPAGVGCVLAAWQGG